MRVENYLSGLMTKLPAEFSHSVGKWAMKHRIFAPGRYETDFSRFELFGVMLPNRIGIAAGFDKHAELQDVVQDYGFGWIEEGSFSLQGGKGGKKPRLFRLKHNGCLINRMGLNCISAEIAAARFEKTKQQNCFGVNIAQSNDPEVRGEKIIHDLVGSFELLKKFGIYTAINLSCPNTCEHRAFDDVGFFSELVSALREKGKVRPVVFKISPNLSLGSLEKMVGIADDFVDGYEAVNTREGFHPKYGRGGLSGHDSLFDHTVFGVRNLRKFTKKKILAVGGISTEEDIYELAEQGASAFLVYTGFVYRHKKNPYAGPNFAHKINNALENLVWKKNFAMQLN